MKKILVFVLLAVALVALYVVLTPTKITNYPSSKTGPIVAFGDSLVFGTGATTPGGFVSMLSEKLNTKIINEGVPGNTTADARERIDTILSHDPKIVILLIGGNDYLRNIPESTTEENISFIISRLHQQGIIVVLLGVRGGLLTDTFDDMFTRLAKKHQTAFVKNVLAGIITKREYMSDAIHPNEKGYELIAERVSEEIEGIVD